MFGAPTTIPEADHRFLYDGHYESDAPSFSIAIWPLGPVVEGRLPVLFGAGDLYAVLSDGENRWGKLAPYPLKELRREEAGWRDVEADYRQDLGGFDEPSGWHVVAGSSSAAAVFFGVQMKPGKVPAELPEGLEVVRGQLPGAKAHPRATVGVWLAEAAPSTAAPFDPADPRVGAAKKALAALFGKKPEPGFVLVPTQELRAKGGEVAAAEREATSGWRAKLEAAFGPLESEGGVLFNGTLRGRIDELDELEDLLDAWFRTDDFAFTDRAATVDRWDGDQTSLAFVDVETLEGELVELAIGQIADGEGGYLLESFDREALKTLLGLEGVAGSRAEIVLGYG